MVPLQNIVSIKCDHSNKINLERRMSSKSLKKNKFSLPLIKSESGIFNRIPEALSAKQFGFLGSMPDMITIQYVKEEKEKGLMRLKKVINQQRDILIFINIESQVVLVHQDSDVIEWWSSTITQVLSRIQKKPRHLLVFINPYGGKGRGKQLWENKISEIFKTAGITCKVG